MQTGTGKMPTSTEHRVEELKRLVRDEFPDFDQHKAEGLLVEAAVTAAAVSLEEEENDSPEFSSHWGQDHEVRAELIRWLCVNHQAKSLIDPFGIQLFAARLTGILNLDYVDVPFPICLNCCLITEPMSLVGVQIPNLVLSGSRTRDIRVDSASVRESVFMDCGFRADGTVSLIGAHIGADLQCEEGTFLA
jgi:hypothetical protein